jgi:hypothetical protein
VFRLGRLLSLGAWWARIKKPGSGVMLRLPWLSFYNEERQHQSLGYRTPRQIYQEGLWICGRSALPTAHIPTGTATNRRIDQKSFEGRVTSASTAIGADIEIRRATP